MVELSIEVVDAAAEPYAAVPTLVFSARLRSDRPVHAIALRSQVRIEPQRRRYEHDEEERLLELFGETPQWGDSLRPFLWAHLDTTVSGFTGETTAALPMTCTYDFEVAGAKYLHSLAAGDVPLVFLFSGTIFVNTGDGFAVDLVPWHLESRYRMPVRVWRDAMDRYFPNAGWVRLSRDTLDRLQCYRVEQGMPTWEQAIEALLKGAGE